MYRDEGKFGESLLDEDVEEWRDVKKWDQITVSLPTT